VTDKQNTVLPQKHAIPTSNNTETICLKSINKHSTQTNSNITKITRGNIVHLLCFQNFSQSILQNTSKQYFNKIFMFCNFLRALFSQAKANIIGRSYMLSTARQSFKKHVSSIHNVLQLFLKSRNTDLLID
jgi:hypothetical protein